MIYQKYLLLALFLLGYSVLFAQADTIDMSSEKERQAILEEMRKEEGKASKSFNEKKDIPNNLWAIKTAPLATADLNFPSYTLDVEYQYAQKYGIVAGLGLVRGKGSQPNIQSIDPDQRGYRARIAARFYHPINERFRSSAGPGIEWIWAKADKQLLVLQEENGFRQLETVKTVIRATDLLVKVNWQYISKQGLLIELGLCTGIRKASIFPTEEFAHVDLNSTTSGFFRQNVQEVRFTPIIRMEMRVGWAFQVKKKGE